MKPITCWFLACVVGCTAAHGDPSPQPAAGAAVAMSPEALEHMLVELAAAKACDRLRGQMRPLRADERAVATGTLWIRDCHATVNRTSVSFAITAKGWRWTQQVRELPEGRFEIADYYRFDTNVVASGTMRVSYEPGTRTARVWYTPTGAENVETLPAPYQTAHAGRALAATGVRDAIVGALSIAIAAPGDAPQLAARGTDAFAAGVVAEIPLCIDAEMFRLGNGKPFLEGVGNPRIPVELRDHGIAVFGPQRVRGPATVYVRALAGSAHAALVCERDAELAATRFLEGRASAGLPELASADVRGEVQLHVEAAHCPLALVLRATNATAQLTWWRPAAELEQLSTPPPLACTPAGQPATLEPPAR